MEGILVVEVSRKLQKVGGSVVLTIPAEIARELALTPGSEVRMRSEGGRLLLDPVSPKLRQEVVEFVARFMDEYDSGLRSLADR